VIAPERQGWRAATGGVRLSRRSRLRACARSLHLNQVA
jgi:hypothetical protein